MHLHIALGLCEESLDLLKFCICSNVPYDNPARENVASFILCLLFMNSLCKSIKLLFGFANEFVLVLDCFVSVRTVAEEILCHGLYLHPIDASNLELGRNDCIEFRLIKRHAQLQCLFLLCCVFLLINVVDQGLHPVAALSLTNNLLQGALLMTDVVYQTIHQLAPLLLLLKTNALRIFSFLAFKLDPTLSLKMMLSIPANPRQRRTDDESRLN